MQYTVLFYSRLAFNQVTNLTPITRTSSSLSHCSTKARANNNLSIIRFGIYAYMLVVCINNLIRQAGIGTYTIPEIATPGISKFRQTLDMMLGTSLNHHVMGGYEFLMENCEYPLFIPFPWAYRVNEL